MKNKNKVDSFISVSADIDNIERKEIEREVKNMIERYKSKFDEAHASIIFRKEKGRFRETDLITCIVKLSTDNGKYYSSATDWGVETSLKSALHTLRYQIDKRFEKIIDKNREVDKRAIV